RRHRDASLAIVALHFGDGSFEADVGDLRQGGGRTVACADVYPPEIAGVRAALSPQTEDDRLRLPACVANGPGIEAGDTKPDRPVHLDGRDPQHPRLGAVDLHAKIRTRNVDGVPHI